MPRIDPDIPKNRFVGAKQSLKIIMLKNSMKIENWKLKITVFGFAILLLALWLPKTVEAGFIIQRPLYIGLTNGLVGSWTFDGPDMAVDTAYDRSGNANNGTLTNGPVRTEGKIGQALNFDGVNDYVDLGSPASLNGTGSHTISLWANLNDIGAPGNYDVFFEKNSDCGVGAGWGMVVYYGTPSTWAAAVVTTSGGAVSYSALGTSPTPTTGTWVHLVGVYDNSAQTITLYTDGVSRQTTNTGSTLRVGDNSTIGVQKPNACTLVDLANAKIDEVRVYNRALSADEIKRLYNMGR